MNDSLVISVSRKTRPSETLLRRLMAALGVLFLLAGIMLSTAFMLPCFLTVLCYYWYRHASKREYEYTLEDDTLKIDRVSDRGRNRLYEIPSGGTVQVVKEDYTSYREDVPYYTVIVRDEPKPLKLLLDLTPEAIRMIRRRKPDAVRLTGTGWEKLSPNVTNN